MIAIRTKNLSPLFTDLLGFGKFLKSIPDVSLVVSPSDGRDWELSGSIPNGVKVYSLMPCLSGSEEIIKSQILALGVQDIIPIFPISENYKDFPLYFPEFGLYGVNDVEDIVSFEDEMDILPNVVRISINPLKYPKELLNYCKDKKIKVLGADIFGPELLREYYLKLFPETFLQAFGEYNTDILEVPGDNPYFIKEVCSRVGEGQENPKLLEYSKTIDKTPSFKISSPKVYQTLRLEIPGLGKISVPGNKGDFSVKKPKEELDLGEPLWEDTLIPEGINQEDKELLGTLHRYHVLPELQELHTPKIWKPVFTKIYPDFWAIKMIPRKWFGWLWKEYMYWMISGKLWKIPLSGHKNLINEKS